MKLPFIVVLLTAVATVTTPTACADPASAASVESFHSAALGRTMRYSVAVPAGPEGTRFPVVYLLHGHGGDYTNWFANTEAAATANALGLVVVAPDGGNSWYLNTATERWEDYIVQDLIQEVERRWPVRAGRQSRAVAGLSMGGYGAMKMAFRHAGTFAVAASMSGAFDTTRTTSVFGRGREAEVAAWFGPPDSATRRENDVYRLAAEVPAAGLPYLYVDCGTDDPWFGINREFAAVLKARGLAHEFHEEPGNHNWRYWDRQVRAVLPIIAKRLQ